MSPETAPDTDLTITVWLSADAQPRQWRLTCDPPGGISPIPLRPARHSPAHHKHSTRSPPIASARK